VREVASSDRICLICGDGAVIGLDSGQVPAWRRPTEEVAVEAIRVHMHGGPEVMRLETLSTTDAGPGQALVELRASGVNYFDLRQRSGDKPGALPLTLGNEGAGTVVALGPDTAVPGVEVGARVAWQMQQGTYATHAVVPVDALVPLPVGIDERTAAAVLLQGLTAQAMCCSAYPVKAGETCLVQAAAGGVGGLLTQIATARGARVIGTVSTADKVETALQAGATDVIVRSEQDLSAVVRELTGGRGVDVVYDGIGRDTFDDGLHALRPHGYFVLYGVASGAVPPFDTHVLAHDGGRYFTHAMVGQYVTDREQLLARSAELFGWVTGGRLKVNIVKAFPLAHADQAHALMGSGKTTGKLLLDIA
jgi:NADPH2:quinone reductase